nr:ROK family protein [Allomuricauda sp.]
MSTNLVIGIDIGGTKISAALFRPNGDILKKQTQLLDKRKGTEVVDLILQMVQSLTNQAYEENYQLNAIGACVPGIYNPTTKTVWAPNIPDWDHIPLFDMLQKGIPNPSTKLALDSDRSCYILGEAWKGKAKGCSDAIFMAIGTGIGAGILSNGKTIQGNGGIAGAIGWMELEPPYHNKYASCGNFEYYASGEGIARSAHELLEANPDTESILKLIPLNELTAHHVFDAFEKRDGLAIQVMDKAILYWGMAIANLVSIFNPEKIIFGGGVFGPGAQFLDQIYLEAKKWAQPISIQEVNLEVSALGGDAGLIGAGYLALTALNGTNVK